MAVLKMKHISICGLKSDRKQIMERLQRLESLEIIGAKEDELDEVFKQEVSSENIFEYEKNTHNADNALGLLAVYAPEKTGLLAGFDGRVGVSAKEYEDFEDKYDDVSEVVDTILAHGKNINDNNAEIVRCTQQIEQLTLWKDLDIPLSYAGSRDTKTYIGVLPKMWTEETIRKQLASVDPVEIEVVSSTKEQTCVVITCLKENADAVADELKIVGFSLPPISCELPPAQEKTKLEKRIEDLEKENEELKEKIAAFADRRNDIKFLSDYDVVKTSDQEATNTIAQSGHTFVLNAYIPEREVKKVEKIIADYDAVIETRDVRDDEDVPVVLSNNAFAAPVTGVVASYALPGKGEIDPSMVVACFYYLFFGLMLSDAMYGLLLTVGSCLLLKLLKNAEPEFKNTLRMFRNGGIATIFWGVIFGSYFGDLFDVIGKEFFGKPDDFVAIPPLWNSALAAGMPMKILTLSLALGTIHITVALIIKIIQCLRVKDILGALTDGVAWLLFADGLIVFGMSTDMICNILTCPKIVSPLGGKIALILAIIGCIIVLLFDGRSSRNPVKRLMKGIYGVYGITGYLSDLLSYSRLLALGLATGVICSVANQLADLVYGIAPGIIGIILFIIVFLLMNAINLFINALGAYVHTNRLQYVEMFGKFYEGGGREMNSFKAKTKYFKFKEN